jgi:hypothetical protein
MVVICDVGGDAEPVANSPGRWLEEADSMASSIWAGLACGRPQLATLVFSFMVRSSRSMGLKGIRPERVETI